MKNEKEKGSKPLDRAKEFAQLISSRIKHKKSTGERTRERIKLDRVGLAKGPNTIANGGKISK